LGLQKYLIELSLHILRKKEKIFHWLTFQVIESLGKMTKKKKKRQRTPQEK
jgi:hypothetical protein